ncbi:phenylalanine--tRNA ligase subunit beta [Lusitaniella coriacea]|uniref:phenylalanine--tRNA ligase subunit beta n=1 Tax=Lusitaniella coriacea TaxID=1983105 RepID=UPI003CEDDCAA
MLISLNWLRELVEVTLPPEQLATVLTIAGFEVENIEDRRSQADGVVVGRVLECERHPNADKLSVCQVDLGGENPSTIVCGASNVKGGIFVAVAPPKTYLPAIDLKIKSAKLRGVKSEGMICSLAELGLEKNSAGIYIFDNAELTPGQDVRPLLGLDDVILDLTSTANRADALSMVGVAREVSALTGAPVRMPEAPQTNIPVKKELEVQGVDEGACPTYIGTMVEGLQIAPSPDWLKFRLQGAGVRPINNVVDVTNYILLEWGQPLHAFDREKLQKLAGGKSLSIGVRFAQPGESLQTLDGQTRKLTEQNVLIVANDKPVALAGVMGGEATEVDGETQNIVLEAALFDPVAIRRSSRAQGLRTEASARYERGVNQAELDWACRRAIALLSELANGTPTAQGMADARPPQKDWTRSIPLRLTRIRQILGQVQRGEGVGELEAAEVEKILVALGCQLNSTKPSPNLEWTVEVPPYRARDLEREIDLIEEVARLYGYDRFCDTLPSKSEPGSLPLNRQLINRIRAAFRGVGLTEVVLYSLVKPEMAQIEIANPLLSEYSALRPELLPGLIDAFAYNWTQGNGALNAFEIGRIFHKKDKFTEMDAIAGIFGGDRASQGRWVTGGKRETLAWYEAKGLLEAVFESLGVTVEYRPDEGDARLHPGRTAALWLEGKRLGTFGQLHPQLRRDRDFPNAVYAFNLSADLLLDVLAQQAKIIFSPYSTYPALERDLAFFAPVEVTVGEFTRAIQKVGQPLLATIELFDRYQGQNVPEGQRSLAFSLSYRTRDRTLTDEEVEPVHQKIRSALIEQFQVTLRS